MSRAGKGWAVALVLAGCTQPSRELTAPFTGEVAFSRCTTVRLGPVCELNDERTLRVWVERDATPSLPVSSREELGGGIAYELAVPGGATELLLQRDTERPWRLALLERQRVPELEEAVTLRAKGELAAAMEVLHVARLDDAASARRTSLEARLLLSSGRADEALGRFDAAIAAHRRLGHVSEELDDGMARAWVLIHHGRRFTEARRGLSELAAAARLVPSGAAQLPYYEGLVLSEAHDVRGALRAFASSEERAKRLALTRQLEALQQVVALQLSALGRHDEALARLVAIERAAEPNGCARANAATNVAWVELAAQRDLDDAARKLQLAVDLFSTTCARPADAANALTDLSLVELQRGRLDEARAALTAARARAPEATPGRLQLWWLDLENRLLLARGKPKEAAAGFRRFEEVARASASTDALWRATSGRARALAASGDTRAALEAFRASEALLDDEYRRLPFGEGLHTSLSERDGSTAAFLELLISQKRVDEAFAVARHARARLIRQLSVAERVASLDAPARERWEQAVTSYQSTREALDAAAAEDWKLAGDRLARVRAARARDEATLTSALDDALATLGLSSERPRQPAPGEVMLLAVPGRGAWLAFAATSDGAQVRRLPGAEAERLLSEFDARIEAATLVSWLPWGALGATDFQRASWRGAPLLAAKLVVWRLDVESGVPERGGGSPLLVTDPTGDLPGARAEAKALAAVLGASTVTLTGDAATPGALRQALPNASLFHYAGHARQSGFAGLESELSLSSGSLTAAEVLVLPVPRTVVLAGCDTAFAPTTGVEVPGLAQAFVLAGARDVVAAWRPVDDAQAAAFSREFHQRLAESDDPARALQAALLKQPGADFRLLRP